MGIIDIFSKRNNDNQKSIFKYDEIPDPLRVQVAHIWGDAIGRYDNSRFHYGHNSNATWDYIHKALCREYGLHSLSEDGYTSIDQCYNFLHEEESVERVLDIIELSFRLIDTEIRGEKIFWAEKGITQPPDFAIEELNKRFQEHGIGYQYLNGKIVRVDSDYIYREAVEPAVNLMFGEGFEGASEEFMNSHEHFKKGNDKEAVTEALKGFESTMKTIFIKKGWELPPKQTASPLIAGLFAKELIPSNLQTQLNSLKTTLEGLATIRNQTTAHGQGEKSVKIPRHLVAYALHLCATNIVFLIEAYKTNK
ncbi:STM4504/CBY_0614 family protein [Peribacillus frigoritolerans]|uniref:STM4504/CBY_0614 family protein n=1 Tax=Peribacillus frigoritolerans TaxID=450367 RepID=UPI003F847289